MAYDTRLFPYFTDWNNRSRYSNATLTEVGNGKATTLITTPHLREKVSKAFKCDGIPGLPLQNFNSTFMETHWNAKLMNFDVMASGDIRKEAVFSDISLSLFEDSGWYKVNYQNSQTLQWANSFGCGHFYTEYMKPQAIACSRLIERADLYTAQSILKYMKLPFTCSINEDNQLVEAFGEQACDDCQCLTYTTWEYGSENKKIGVGCYSWQKRTDSDVASIVLRDRIVQCPKEGGRILVQDEIPGLLREIDCPPSDAMTTVCPNQCRGLGACLNG